MAQYTVDHVGRMKQIKATLDQPDETADAVHKKQDMLEELLDIVDNIDYARGTPPARSLLLTTFVLYNCAHLMIKASIAKHIPMNTHVVIHHPAHLPDVAEETCNNMLKYIRYTEPSIISGPSCNLTHATLLLSICIFCSFLECSTLVSFDIHFNKVSFDIHFNKGSLAPFWCPYKSVAVKPKAFLISSVKAPSSICFTWKSIVFTIILFWRSGSIIFENSCKRAKKHLGQGEAKH